MAESDALYRFEEADDFCTVVLLPELNKAPWGDIDNIGTSVLERMNARLTAGRSKPGFIVDLSALNYMGSAMVALVVRLWKAAREKNARMVVVNDDPMVLEVLELAGLTQVWTIVQTRQDALKTLGVSEKKPEPAIAGGGTGARSFDSQPAARPANVTPWLVLTLLLLIAAGVGLYLFAADPSPVDDVRISLGLLFGGALLGLITATATASLGTGLSRTFGMTCVPGMLALLVSGVYVHPHRDVLFKGRNAKANQKDRRDAGGPPQKKKKKGDAPAVKKSKGPNAVSGKPDGPTSNGPNQPVVAPKPPKPNGKSKTATN